MIRKRRRNHFTAITAYILQTFALRQTPFKPNTKCKTIHVTHVSRQQGPEVARNMLLRAKTRSDPRVVKP